MIVAHLGGIFRTGDHFHPGVNLRIEGKAAARVDLIQPSIRVAIVLAVSESGLASVITVKKR